MRSAAMLCVSDCVHDGIRPGVPQATEWQRVGNEIDAARIFARANFVNVGALEQLWYLPKDIGLRSNRRLSGVLVKMSWITLPDVSTHLQPG